MSKKMPAWLNRECGGRVPKREAGGRTVISEDSKREAARLRKESNSDAEKVGNGLLNAGMGAVLGSIVRGSARSGVGRVVGRALQGVGALSGVGAIDPGVSGVKKAIEAGRIERGEVTPGEEDRKSGGRVKRAKKK